MPGPRQPAGGRGTVLCPASQVKPRHPQHTEQERRVPRLAPRPSPSRGARTARGRRRVGRAPKHRSGLHAGTRQRTAGVPGRQAPGGVSPAAPGLWGPRGLSFSPPPAFWPVTDGRSRQSAPRTATAAAGSRRAVLSPEPQVGGGALDANAAFLSPRHSPRREARPHPPYVLSRRRSFWNGHSPPPPSAPTCCPAQPLRRGEGAAGADGA